MNREYHAGSVQLLSLKKELANPPTKWKMHSVAVLHDCSTRDVATLAHHPQIHNHTDISVLWHWRTAGIRITSMHMMQGCTTACKA